MKSKQLNERYAKALLELSLETGKLETVFADMQNLITIIIESRELQLLLQSPVIRNSKKEQIMSAIFKNRFDELSLRFISIIVRKNREILLREIAQTFIELYRDYKGIIKASFCAVVPLTNDEKKSVVDLLENQTGKKIELSESSDKQLLGGFIMKWGDMQYDATLRSKLNKIRKEVGNNRIYE